MDFPGGSEGKESACNVGDPASIPGSGRSPDEGNGNPLQYSCLENPQEQYRLVSPLFPLFLKAHYKFGILILHR